MHFPSIFLSLRRIVFCPKDWKLKVCTDVLFGNHSIYMQRTSFLPYVGGNASLGVHPSFVLYYGGIKSHGNTPVLQCCMCISFP